MNAIDTNVLIYSIDASDARKRQSAVELLESLDESDTVIPWQVACETAAVIRTMAIAGKFRGDYQEAVSALRSCFPVVLPQLSILDRSLQLQLRHQVSPWDALLIAACAEAGVTRLFTEDLQGQSIIDGVQLVNPFA